MIEKELVEIKTRISGVQEVANSLIVQNQEDLDSAGDFLKQISNTEKIITQKKQEITKPLMASLAKVRDLFKPLEHSLSKAKEVIKSKMLDYTIEEEEKAEKKKEAIAKKVETGKMSLNSALEKLEAIQSPKTNTRTELKFSVENIDLIPKEYFILNIELVKKDVKNGVEIPGIKVYQEKKVVVKK
jgi:hypothetical protein